MKLWLKIVLIDAAIVAATTAGGRVIGNIVADRVRADEPIGFDFGTRFGYQISGIKIGAGFGCITVLVFHSLFGTPPRTTASGGVKTGRH